MRIFILILFIARFSTAQTPLSEAAVSLTKDKVRYEPAYVVINYPNGNVPAHTGVCTDVIIRAYRKIGIDLQKEVHEYMKKNFSAYPKKWGLKSTDRNIDHRRVPNLRTFFTRKGASLPVTNNPADYKPGNVVDLPNNNLTHIGIVSHKRSSDGLRPLIVHNIGAGQVLEDVLFAYKITGNYNYKNTGK
jgi:uncharacterized protein YijF (DUF1287 family)